MHLEGLAFAFAALRKPCAESFGEALRSEAEAGFDFAVRDRECVVEVGGVGEVAHAELIEPVERAGARFSADNHIDVEFLCVHEIEKGDLEAPLHLRATKCEGA